MKPAPFEYHAPGGLEAAVALLAELGDDASVLAGGQSLVPLLNMRLARPDHLVDVSRLPELTGMTVGPHGVVVGAAVRQRRVERDSGVAAVCPLLADAVPWIGHAAIRTRGTVGGSITHADPAGELPLVALVTGAELVAAGPGGQRAIAAADFFEMPFTTALRPGEILAEVRFPATRPGEGTAFLEIARRHGDFPLVSVAVSVVVEDGTVTAARIGFGGVAGTPVRSVAAEHAIVGGPVGEGAWQSAAAAVGDELEPGDDIHATSDYRRRVAAVLARRALPLAASKAGVAA